MFLHLIIYESCIYQDYEYFSEFMIGHAGSTCWRKKRLGEGKSFQESRTLSYLNIHNLKRQGADIQSKIEELEIINVSLRERDKMKDDIISGLSDKLITLSERMEAIAVYPN